jgi:hypothetical protein
MNGYNRSPDGKVYLVRGYMEDRAGQPIPDEWVIRAANGRWFTSEEVCQFKQKSTARCPTYGLCKTCFGSGPNLMYCQACRHPGCGYKVVRDVESMKILEAEWISRFFATTHVVADADRTQAWVGQPMYNMSYSCVPGFLNTRWEGRHLMQERQPGYEGEFTRLFNEGIIVNYPGPWDASENPVQILVVNNENRYDGR